MSTSARRCSSASSSGLVFFAFGLLSLALIARSIRRLKMSATSSSIWCVEPTCVLSLSFSRLSRSLSARSFACASGTALRPGGFGVIASIMPAIALCIIVWN
jgi:hypothetical protein